MSNKIRIITDTKAVKRILLAWKIMMGIFVLFIVVNILAPLLIKKDGFIIQKVGCYGLDINDTCIGLAKYDRILRNL